MQLRLKATVPGGRHILPWHAKVNQVNGQRWAGGTPASPELPCLGGQQRRRHEAGAQAPSVGLLGRLPLTCLQPLACLCQERPGGSMAAPGECRLGSELIGSQRGREGSHLFHLEAKQENPERQSCPHILEKFCHRLPLQRGGGLPAQSGPRAQGVGASCAGLLGHIASKCGLCRHECHEMSLCLLISQQGDSCREKALPSPCPSLGEQGLSPGTSPGF